MPRSVARGLVLIAAAFASSAAFRLPSPLERPGHDSAGALSRRQLLGSLSSAALLAASLPLQARAEGGNCKLECFRECDTLAPGNQDYCTSQCDTYCDSLGPNEFDELKKKEQSSTDAGGNGGSRAPPKDCSVYQSADARDACESEKSIAATKTAAGQNLGLFGDSGVTYSNGVEDLFATAFGAKRQNKDINKADIGDFTSEVSTAAKAAILGGTRAQ